jgi:ABC-type Na+ efflux pump permease subunit
MNARTILYLLGKEYKILFRSKIFLMFSIVLLAALIGLFYVLPSEISQQTPTIAVYAETDASSFFYAWDESAEAIHYQEMPSVESLMNSVQNGDHAAGIVITELVWQDIEEGRQSDVILYTAPGLAEEYVQSISFVLDIVFSETIYRSEVSSPRIAIEEIWIGDDILQNNVSFKRQMIPLMVSLLLVMEVFSLGISLVEEKESRSIKAVLTAPVSMSEFLFAKSLAGISVILLQCLIFLAAVGALTAQIPFIILVILAGAVLTTGISALLAAYSSDMMSLVSKGVFVMILMIVPLFGILFPGMLSSWMQAVPTYMLADSLNRLINHGMTWQTELIQPCLLSVTAIIVLYAGIACIRRKVQCQ